MAENPYTAPPDVNTTNLSLYFNDENVGETITASRGGNILRESVD